MESGSRIYNFVLGLKTLCGGAGTKIKIDITACRKEMKVMINCLYFMSDG